VVVSETTNPTLFYVLWTRGVARGLLLPFSFMALTSGHFCGITIEVIPALDTLRVACPLLYSKVQSRERFPSSWASPVVVASLRALRLGSHLCLGSSEGPFWPNDVRNYLPNLFMRGRKVFCDHALAHRSWTFLLFPRDRPMIML
jgi:hypothetical protein